MNLAQFFVRLPSETTLTPGKFPQFLAEGTDALESLAECMMTIDGQAVTTDRTFEVINPATEIVLSDCPVCAIDHVDQAVTAAERAFSAWRADETIRRNGLNDCAQAVKSHLADLSELLTLEQGKPRRQSLQEITGAIHWLQLTANTQMPVDVLQDDGSGRVEVRRKPLGVVAAITPWNFPVILAIWKIAPALLAGNTVVLKPSPYTPLTTLKLGEILNQVLPAGVLNVISGGDEIGAHMVTHPMVRKISMTGSIDTGKAVAAAAAPDLKRVVLELGGNDPAIVLPDVNIEEVAEDLLWGAFENCGQVCQAIKRLYVHDTIHGPLLDAMGELAGKLNVGNGMTPGTQLGPINNRPQFERVVGLVADARERGARIVTGGNTPDGPGFFYTPTLVADIPDDAPLVTEEQFGPVLPVLSYTDTQDAIQRANATQFGLGGSIWTRDLEQGAQLVSQLECGTGWVNQHNELYPDAPLGGVKWSGMGHQNGRWGLDEFCALQVVCSRPNPE